MPEKEMISMEEAKKEVELASRRVGLLHLAYAETLIEKFGEEKGKEIILAAIKNYGLKVGKKVKQEVEKLGEKAEPENYGIKSSRNLPKFGMNDKVEEVEVDGEKRLRAYGCVMAKVWKEYGKEDIGKLYCYVDPAKYMGFNPNYKMIHTKNLPSHDEFCEFIIEETTEKERNEFFDENSDWSHLDEKLK